MKNYYVEGGRRHDLGFDRDLGRASLRERITERWVAWRHRSAYRRLARVVAASRRHTMLSQGVGEAP